MAGVPGGSGRRVQKPVVQERRTGNGNVKVTAETVLVQTKRLATVTHRNATVSQNVNFLKGRTSKTQKMF